MSKLSETVILKDTAAFGNEAFGKQGLETKVSMQFAKLVNGGLGYTENDDVEATEPMVAEIGWVPTVGDLVKTRMASYSGFQDDLSNGMFRMYLALRSANTSISAYDVKDVVKMIIATANLAVMVGDLRKHFGIAYLDDDPANAAKAGLLRATEGINYAQVANVGNELGQFNLAIRKLTGLAVPKGIDIFDRWYELSKSILIDDPTIRKTQMVVFKPTHVWMLDTIATSTHVGELRLIHWSRMTMQQKLEFLYNYAQRLQNDQDWANIMAEVKKACLETERINFDDFVIPSTKGDDGSELFGPEARDNLQLNIIEDMQFSDQLRNAIYTGEVACSYYPGITDSNFTEISIIDNDNYSLFYKSSEYRNNTLYCTEEDLRIETQDLGFVHFIPRHNTKVAVHTHKDFPSAEDFLFETRYVCELDPELVTPQGYTPEIHAHARFKSTELFEYFKTYKYSNSSLNGYISTEYHTFNLSDVWFEDVEYNELYSFSCAPNIYYGILMSDDNFDMRWFHGDLDVYKFIEPSRVKDMHLSMVGASFIPLSITGSSDVKTEGGNRREGKSTNKRDSKRRGHKQRGKSEKKDSKEEESQESKNSKESK